jgi:cation diffusion facilitator CzcD-associated flavoprotein CzcO
MESFGGTWLQHNYPGIRSDSDLFTFGYRFKAWKGAPIASGQQILDYLGEVIDENDLARHLRYNHRISDARWDSRRKLWTITARHTASDQVLTYTCNFLWMCQGYYRHSEGYTPDWPDMAKFQGDIVHPQTWPEDLKCSGKRVVVIGSGATAATLVPAIADKCAHVTMLQRSPTYFSPAQNRNKLADTLRELDVDDTLVHDIVRRKMVVDQRKYLQHTIKEPEEAKAGLLTDLAKHLPQDIIDEHFTPSYRPWQQRIAVVPDGDLFKSITSGNASVVTDHIDRFTENGILLKSGRELEADIIITATGFDLCVLGDIHFEIDGKPLVFSETVTYRGMMFTGVPNMAWIMGYFRAASWTLRVDMVADFVCRLLNHMKDRGLKTVAVELRPEERGMKLQPWIDEEHFNPGYMMRNQHLLPKRGENPEWAHSQDYWWERDVFPAIDIEATPFVYDGGSCGALDSMAEQINS